MSIWINETDVRAQLEGAGLLLKGALQLATPEGYSRRCKVAGMGTETRGWYRLGEWVTAEGVMLVGTYGVFKGMDSNTRKIELSKRCDACGFEMPLKAKECPHCKSKAFKSRELSADEKAAFKARMDEDRKREEAARKAKAEKAAREAARVWNAYLPIGESDYLQRKGVGAHGVRFDPNGHGTMLVPMLDARGKVHGLQIIRGKNRGGKLEKQYFPAGLAKQGHYHLIGGMPTWICLVAEGYATAASLYEATGLPVAVAFDAGNLVHVSAALHKHYKRAQLLICADDDYLTEGNPGVTAASTAALAVGGAFVAPVFAADRGGRKLTDFNDLQALEGQHAVRGQIEARLLELKWSAPAASGAGRVTEGGGENLPMAARLTIDEAAARFWGTYGLGGKALFDEVERRLVHKDDVLNLLPSHGWDELKKHPGWRVARDHEIGFDPTERDASVKCNLFGGWPTVPRAGKCDALLDLLFYLCSKDSNGRAINDWILKWLAYPLQHRGAKMQSAIVVHGPQGTGKSRFFEAICEIYGIYGRVIGQDALEDKFNSDWDEKKLFLVADEVMARQDMFHTKNRLKGFITGTTIRVNPKNVAAHTEKNQVNLVFLSNERQPMILENDDRRHCVIWTPPKPDESFFAEVNDEIDNGGIAALHHYLLNLDLGDFKPWTKPPMTDAKQDLIDLGLSSEERFMREWQRLEIEGRDGEPVPFVPCLGSHLYRAYENWCRDHGEFRPRPANHVINFFAKQAGWSAGKPESTWTTLTDKKIKGRKMVVPSDTAMIEAAAAGGVQADMLRDRFGTKAEWLTAGFFAFERAIEANA